MQKDSELCVVKQTALGGARFAVCVLPALWGRWRKVGRLKSIFPDGQGDTVIIVFLYTGLLRFLLSPKTQTMSENKLHFSHSKCQIAV